MIEVIVDKRKMVNLKKMMERVSFDRRPEMYVSIMRTVANLVETKLKLNISGPILKVRSGTLRNSMQSRVFATRDAINAVIGSGVRTGKRVSYAEIHETGGVIRPKPGNKYLRIPIRAGSPEAINMGLWNYKRGPKAGTPRKGISFSSSIIAWRSVKQVTIPARRYMTRTRDQMESTIMSVIKGKIMGALNEQTG